MAEPFVGEIRMFGIAYAPKGWAFCSGEIMTISQHSLLFVLLGKTYGGNGTSNFALPDLRGRVPVCAGQGTGLSNYARGATGGVRTVTLTTQELPAHTHPLTVVDVQADISLPQGATFAGSSVRAYTGAGNAMGSAVALPMEGGGQPHINEQPYLALNFCIALNGLFRARP